MLKQAIISNETTENNNNDPSNTTTEKSLLEIGNDQNKQKIPYYHNIYDSIFARKTNNGSRFSYVCWGNVKNINDANIYFLGSYHNDDMHNENAKLIGDLSKQNAFPNGILVLGEGLAQGKVYSSIECRNRLTATPVYEYLSNLNIPNLEIVGWDCTQTPAYRVKRSLIFSDDPQRLYKINKLEIEERNNNIVATLIDAEVYLNMGYKIVVDAGRGHYVDYDGAPEKFTQKLRKFIKEKNYKHVFIIPEVPPEYDNN